MATLMNRFRISPERMMPLNSYVPGTDPGSTRRALCRSIILDRSSGATNWVQDILFSTSSREYPVSFSKLEFASRMVVSSAMRMLAVAVLSKMVR
jgi:hypothetical protein